MFRRLVAAGAIILTAVVGTLVLPTPSVAAGELSNPVADTYVKSDFPMANYGARTSLLVRGGTKQAISYLKFDVTGITQRVTRALLRVHVTDITQGGSTSGGSVYKVANNSWAEDSVMYDNRPALILPALARLGPVVRNNWYEVDVTAAVRGNGLVSFGIASTSGNTAYYDSRESGPMTAPVLVVEDAPTPPADPVLLAAGDIADCVSTGDEATAALLAANPGTVAPLGDLVYPSGTPAQFTDCYGPSWGVFKARTRPAVGNHEYLTTGAAGYFGYFGALAGDPTKGYYSYNLGRWHIVVLNSNCAKVGGCGAGSPQLSWLRVDLAANPADCTLAYWHHPLFTSGSPHTGATNMRPLYQALYDANAEVVLSGHNHNYERFAPQDPAGNADPDRGIREFVVGTGGESHYASGTPVPNSQVRNHDTFGVLKLTLHDVSYTWQFLPVAGKTFTDSGSTSCH